MIAALVYIKTTVLKNVKKREKLLHPLYSTHVTLLFSILKLSYNEKKLQKNIFSKQKIWNVINKNSCRWNIFSPYVFSEINLYHWAPVLPYTWSESGRKSISVVRSLVKLASESGLPVKFKHFQLLVVLKGKNYNLLAQFF